jgi:hypothetical protein
MSSHPHGIVQKGAGILQAQLLQKGACGPLLSEWQSLRVKTGLTYHQAIRRLQKADDVERRTFLQMAC